MHFFVTYLLKTFDIWRIMKMICNVIIIRKRENMNFIGDYFAVGLVIVLCMFYFERKYFLSKSSRYFVLCLLLTGATAVTDILTGALLTLDNIPHWVNMSANSLYFIINIVTTSTIALFLFTKLLEHAYDDHCMVYAKRGLAVLFTAYLILVALNLKTGWMFYFDQTGVYQRGPLNAAGYAVTICQMGLVIICFHRNRKNASKSMRRALVQTFPVIVLCIIIQRIYPEIMLNAFIMSMMDTVLFLTFQGQRQGIHTLTKLNDRHRFFRDAEFRAEAGERSQVFLINIHNFGEINQKYGHVHGDEILYQFAFALERLIRRSMAFHMNGTVFALTIPYSTEKAAMDCRNSLLNFMDSGIEFLQEHVDLDYTVTEYITGDEAMNAADFYEKLEYSTNIAYKAKRRYILYTREIGDQMDRRRYLTDRLRSISREQGFQVWFQPVHCMHSRQFCSMEALLRLFEPDGTMISPLEFIPLAEESGLISDVTWFVAEEVCRFLSENAQTCPASVSINLPMAQLLEPGFHAHLNKITAHYGIEHHKICLEFTERAILENFIRTKAVMEQLTQDGYRFYLDDFGTGYSNFNCLLQLPFQFIKLDASLVNCSSDGHADYGLIRTLTDLFHNMNLKVIAEGAETQQDVNNLKEYGIDRIQGYYFAKPMAQDKLLKFYEENPLPDN